MSHRRAGLMAGRLSMAALLACLWGQAATCTVTAETGPTYRRPARPRFDATTIQGRETRLVFGKMDLKNNLFVARVVQKRDVLHEVEFRFEAPPRDVGAGQSLELKATVRSHLFHPDADAQYSADVEFLLTPEDHFSVTGFPVRVNPTRFSLADLRTAADAEDHDEPATQRVAATVQAGEDDRLVCGYVLRMGWGEDLHEVRVEYAYRIKKRWWKVAPSVTEDATPEPGAPNAAAVAVPDRPWQDASLTRLFAVYLASVNEALRTERGPEWAVDAWGRELGPATVLPVRPGGKWENPNHYLWVTNARYDSYPVGIRDFLLDRLRAEAEPPAAASPEI